MEKFREPAFTHSRDIGVLGCLGVCGCFVFLGCLEFLGLWGVLGFGVSGFWGVLFFGVFGDFGVFGYLEVLWCLGVLGATFKRLRG